MTAEQIFRLLVRLPLVVIFAAASPLFWMLAFGEGESPKEATKMIKDMIKDVAGLGDL